MGWLVALGILVLLAVLPLGVSLRYDSEGLQIKIIAGLLRLQIIPTRKKADKSSSKKKREKPVKEKKTAHEQTPAKTSTEDRTVQKGGSFMDFLPMVQLALDFLGAFTGKLRVHLLEMNLVLAGDDPCDLAINYGRAWAALGNLWPKLEEIFVIKKRNVQIQCDFVASQTLVTASLDLSITLGRLLQLVGCYGVRAVMQYVKITNKRKGGAAT